MLKFILGLVLCVNIYADTKDYLADLYRLKASQIEVLKHSYHAGKEYDLSYTLMSIAWKESNFGKWTVNITDGSKLKDNKYPGAYGIYQALLKTVMSRHELTTSWSASRTIEKLLYDIDYSSREAIYNLLYWKKYWSDRECKQVWSMSVASYNAGYNSNKHSPGKKYLIDIKDRVRALKVFLKHNSERIEL